jgi:hypothetical protein
VADFPERLKHAGTLDDTTPVKISGVPEHAV